MSFYYIIDLGGKYIKYVKINIETLKYEKNELILYFLLYYFIEDMILK